MSHCNQIFTVMLRCPDLKSASNIAASVVEDELSTVLKGYDDIVDDGIAHGWMENSYQTQVRCRLFNDQGQARITGGEDEFWNAIQNPKKAIKFYAKEADALMTSIMDHNHDTLLDVASNYIIESVVVARKFPELWVVHITGAQL